MPRRIISDPNHACAVEMHEVDPNQAPLLPNADDSSFGFPQDDLCIDRADDAYEFLPEIRETGFRDSARIFVDKLAAQKDELKKTALGAAISETPEIVHHLTTHLPIVGPIISAATMTQEIDSWKCTFDTLQDFKSFNHRTPKESYLKPTLEYIVAQFENKKFKQEILLYGKLAQLSGGITTTCGLFTAGATVIPGLAISTTGSLIRISVNIRSAIRHQIKKKQKKLSVDREEHAAKLFALSVEYIKRKRNVDLIEYLNDPVYERYSQSTSFIEDINCLLSPEEQKFSSILSALIVRTLKIKDYPDVRDPNLEKLPDFLRLGHYEIFNALKS